jgi:hypothetical protein
MVPIWHGTVQRLQVERCDDLVSLGQVFNLVTHTYDLARQVRAGYHVVFDWEGVLSGSNGEVAEVESYALDPDQNFLGGGLRHLFFVDLEVLDGCTLRQAEHALCSHDEWFV